VTAEANAVSFFRAALLDANDLANIAAALNVETSRPVALLAVNGLLRMKAVPVALYNFIMAHHALLISDSSRSGNFHVLSERLDRLMRFCISKRLQRESQGKAEKNKK
jgi:hypothetical protein